MLRSCTQFAYDYYLKMPPWVRMLAHYLVNSKVFKWLSAYLFKFLDDKAVAVFIKNIVKFIDKKDAIFYVQPTIMDFTGIDFYNGGAERYAIDLNKILVEQGYEFFCVQYSRKKPWIRNYYGLTIIGLPSFSNIIQFKRNVACLTNGAALIISSPFTLVEKVGARKIIGISHGIYWDHSFPHESIRSIIKKIKFLDKLVSVDTATLNFVRGCDIASSNKVIFVPNYVDHAKFLKNKFKKNQQKELIILYPRSLYAARGFWIVHAIVPKILNEYDNVCFLFCGKVNQPEVDAAVQALMDQYPNRVKHIVVPPHAIDETWRDEGVVEKPRKACVDGRSRKRVMPSSHCESNDDGPEGHPVRVTAVGVSGTVSAGRSGSITSRVMRIYFGATMAKMFHEHSDSLRFKCINNQISY